jgi:hypothetical protein
MLVAQLETGIDAASKALDGRSDSVVLVLVMIGFAAFVLWQNSRSVTEREKNDSVRDEREAQRWQLQREEDRKVTERNAVALEVVAKGMTQAGEASSIMASCSKRTEGILESFLTNQECDRAAILSVIDFADAHSRNDSEEAKQALRRARESLTRRQASGVTR